MGGKFNYWMEAKDGSVGFNYEGEFTSIHPHRTIHYKLDDNREVKVEFIKTESGTKVIETFDAEDENSAEQQRQGWIGILNNFKKRVEARTGNE